MTCTWCGHPEHTQACAEQVKAGRPLGVQLVRRLAGKVGEHVVTVPCACARHNAQEKA